MLGKVTLMTVFLKYYEPIFDDDTSLPLAGTVSMVG